MAAGNVLCESILTVYWVSSGTDTCSSLKKPTHLILVVFQDALRWTHSPSSTLCPSWLSALHLCFPALYLAAYCQHKSFFAFPVCMPIRFKPTKAAETLYFLSGIWETGDLRASFQITSHGAFNPHSCWSQNVHAVRAIVAADYNNEFVWMSQSVSSWYQLLQQGPWWLIGPHG